MPVPSAPPAFSELVASEQWWQDVAGWAEDALSRLGLRIRGPLTRHRTRPWSTQVLVPTDQGLAWFKASCAAMRFEPALQSALARFVPEAVEPPLAIDPARGWMLTAEHPRSIAEQGEETAEHWRSLILLAARTQRRLVEHRETLLATGLPDCSPGTVPDRFDQLLDALMSLPPQRPSHLCAEEAELLRSRRGELVEACAALEQSPFPVTFQHGDLHLHNAYADGRLRLFDFGDAQWASAVEALAVPFAIVSGQERARWEELVASYLKEWDIDHTAGGVAWNAAHFTHAVNRAFTWWRCLATATPQEWEQWGEAPLAHLREMMRP